MPLRMVWLMKEKMKRDILSMRVPVILLLVLLFALVTSAQAYEICGPEKVTRGGIAIYNPVADLPAGFSNPDLDVDGVFGIYVKKSIEDGAVCNNYPNCSIFDCKSCMPITAPMDTCNCSCYYDSPLIAGFTINPQTMTGAYGDRPPFFSLSQSIMNFSLSYGSYHLSGCRSGSHLF